VSIIVSFPAGARFLAYRRVRRGPGRDRATMRRQDGRLGVRLSPWAKLPGISLGVRRMNGFGQRYKSLGSVIRDTMTSVGVAVIRLSHTSGWGWPSVSCDPADRAQKKDALSH